MSIIISAHNSEKYISLTLESVLQQTYHPIEIIVVNDGSLDKTKEIVMTFELRGVKLINQTNKGQDAALNVGYHHSTGKYIKFMDSDDLLNHQMIETQISFLKNSTEHVGYGEWARFYNHKPDTHAFDQLEYWRDMSPMDFLTSEPNGVMLQCGIMMIPRNLIEKAGVWDERLILFNDTEFFTRILLKSKGVIFTRGARLYYRSGMPGSISAGRARKFYESTFLATQLISKHMLEAEDSPRVRRLLSNTFLMQRYHMFPKYNDLALKHDAEVLKIGYGTYQIEGGAVLKMLFKLFGWKAAKRIQLFFYKLGYLKFVNKGKHASF